ncbi:MAG: hypothetical protein JXA81_11570 [Sedimentisphaerales bacterium]|nr:hypothetical protein [Sedimentisphaerales bacterium]
MPATLEELCIVFGVRPLVPSNELLVRGLVAVLLTKTREYNSRRSREFGEAESCRRVQDTHLLLWVLHVVNVPEFVQLVVIIALLPSLSSPMIRIVAEQEKIQPNQAFAEARPEVVVL